MYNKVQSYYLYAEYPRHFLGTFVFFSVNQEVENLEKSNNGNSAEEYLPLRCLFSVDSVNRRSYNRRHLSP